jgi:hypothetical protein
VALGAWSFGKFVGNYTDPFLRMERRLAPLFSLQLELNWIMTWMFVDGKDKPSCLSCVDGKDEP